MQKKSILLIAPNYFGYDHLIKTFLQESGNKVDLLPDRPLNSNFGKALIRLSRRFAFPVANKFFKEKITDLQRETYDVVWVIQGEGVSPELLIWLREKYSKASFIWYLWDSFENKPALKENLPFFDKVYTFDPKDAVDNNIGFQPLFFSPSYANLIHSERKFDLCFIGTGHADRFQIVSALKKTFTEKQFFTFIFLQTPIIYFFRRIFDKNLKDSKYSDFSFNKMSQKQVQDIVSQADIIIDVQHPDQRGLTMRTLETMGARKKLVTTNTEIRNYDFYDERNICIIDRKLPTIPNSFFNNLFNPLPNHINEKYSIRGFVKSMLGEEFV